MTVLDPPVAAAEERAPGGATPRARRPEIEGLRALAVGLVVVHHVFSGRVSGGVDVFLTLTGFFLVVTLGERFAGADGFDPLRPIARTLSRLAPAGFLVLVATALAALWVAPPTRWREVADHLMSSATFTENLRLVDESVSYAALTATTSPMQQFWSLSIQVQVLLAAPFVVAAVGLLLRRLGWSRHGRRVAIVSVGAGTAASFAWALAAVRTDQQAAYFATAPRLWELGAGALAGLLLLGRAPRPAVAVALGWLGVVGLVVCGAVLDGARTFPGWQALWPVLCALAILYAADVGGARGAHRLLSLPALQWIGRRSYGIYLWHWPILVLFMVHSGDGRPVLLPGLGIIAAAVVLAALTYRLAELPLGNLLRSRRPAWAVVLVVACAAPLLGLGMATTTQLDRQLAFYRPAVDDPNYPGARALDAADVTTGGVRGVEFLPLLSVVRNDWAWADSTCATDSDDIDEGRLAAFICERGSKDAARHVLLVGDSHTAHWQQPLAAMAEDHGWRFTSLLNPGCYLSTESERVDRSSSRYADCATWRSTLVERIDAFDPDVVVALGTRIAPGEEEVVPEGFVEAWEQLGTRGIPVVAMRDNPRHPGDVPDCQAELGDHASDCVRSPDAVYDDEVLSAPLPAGVRMLDTRDYFCTESECPAVIGNIRVYSDDAHITGSYMRTVRPLLEPDFLALTGWGTR
jgi:peptidoglycan/LPS O-acetylase OafA/YrhL